MTLKEYVAHLNRLMRENPKAKDMTVMYASDAEGNSFDEVFYAPNVGMLHEYEYGQTVLNDEDDAKYFKVEFAPNVVLIN